MLSGTWSCVSSDTVTSNIAPPEPVYLFMKEQCSNGLLEDNHILNFIFNSTKFYYSDYYMLVSKGHEYVLILLSAAPGTLPLVLLCHWFSALSLYCDRLPGSAAALLLAEVVVHLTILWFYNEVFVKSL